MLLFPTGSPPAKRVVVSVPWGVLAVLLATVKCTGYDDDRLRWCGKPLRLTQDNVAPPHGLALWKKKSFKYVLTRPFNSDPVESLFSCFRQFNGGNDRVDARTAVFTAEKLLKASQIFSECQAALSCANVTCEVKNPAVPEDALAVLWKIQHVMKYDEVPSEIEFAPLTYLAGYLVFVCERKVTCPECKLLLKGKPSRDGAYKFVSGLDQGGLSYARPEAVWLCKLICTFVERALMSAKLRRCARISKLLSNAVLPCLKDCPVMWCKDCIYPQHCEELCEIFVKKLLRPLLANWAGDVNSSLESILKLSRKPLSRKVLRL
ncbi:hypothetical protein V5799_000586 [Amblyomma americanum]|uniref:Uncharacterized protein n=1 Tax=Amblyomma americanum TaxID=6943 RepID=A0AAQ4D2M2_AMBAM